MGLLITWQLVLFGYSQQLSTITSSVLKTPVYPFIYAVGLGFLVLSIVYVFEIVQNIRTVARISKWSGWAVLAVAVVLLFLVCYLIINNKDLSCRLSLPRLGSRIVVLVVLLFSSMPIGMVMAIVGFLGMAYVADLTPPGQHR